MDHIFYHLLFSIVFFHITKRHKIIKKHAFERGISLLKTMLSVNKIIYSIYR